MSPRLGYDPSQTTPLSTQCRQQIWPRPVRTWTDGAAGSIGPDTITFASAAEAAHIKKIDLRRVRQRNARLVHEAERTIREALIRDAARELLASGAAGSISDAWHVASGDLLKANLAAEARKKYPAATEEGIRRRVVKELDIRDAMRDRKEAVAARLAEGYRWEGGEDPATGRERAAFVYEGLRSDEHELLKLFASCLPKARPGKRDADETELKQSLMVGTKEYTRAVGSKLLGLDKVYVEGQKSIRGFIRVDCDGCFASWDALRLALIDVLDSIELLPHLVVADELSDGRIVRPHFIWLLPEKSRVRFDSKALPGPQRLYHAVARALTAACIPVGGDVGGLSNMMRVKNPLSPHWATAVMNERDPLSLGDMFVRLEPWVGEDETTMSERQTAVRGAAVGLDTCQSNVFFREATAACWSLARQWIDADDDRGKLVGDDLAEAFAVALGHDARHAMTGVPSRKAMAMLGSVCRWAARHFDPSARRRTAHPGVLRGTLGGLSLHDRQAAGGRHAASSRRDASLDAIRQAAAALRAEGVEVTKTAVARRAGIAYRTVLRLWDEAAAVVSKAPKTSAKIRMTDGLRKIAAQAPAAQSNPTATTSSESQSFQTNLSAHVISTPHLHAVPSWSSSEEAAPEINNAWLNMTDHDAWPEAQELCDDDPWDDKEGDKEIDDAGMLDAHDAWLAAQESCCTDDYGSWDDDLFADAA